MQLQSNYVCVCGLSVYFPFHPVNTLLLLSPSFHYSLAVFANSRQQANVSVINEYDKEYDDNNNSDIVDGNHVTAACCHFKCQVNKFSQTAFQMLQTRRTVVQLLLSIVLKWKKKCTANLIVQRKGEGDKLVVFKLAVENSSSYKQKVNSWFF